jgi:hypothetical protein
MFGLLVAEEKVVLLLHMVVLNHQGRQRDMNRLQMVSNHCHSSVLLDLWEEKVVVMDGYNFHLNLAGFH